MNSFEPQLKERTYDSRKQDLALFNKWQEEQLFKFNKDSNSGIDMIARYKRMSGFEVLFPMCLDRNGLPIEVQTEKEFQISMQDVPREDFLKLCKQVLDRVGGQILHVCKILGFSNNSFNWEEVYKTDQEQYRSLTQATFIKLFREGLVYEDNRPNNYCTRCKTTIADNEIDYKSGSHLLYNIKFKVKETEDEIIISTSRPELIPAIGVVIFNPKDDRYKHLEGKTVVTPLFEDEVPILPHHYAKMEFGSGIMMVCAYGDSSDVQIFRELNLTPRPVIDVDGKITEAVPKYAGLKVKEARRQIAKNLEEEGYIVEKTTVPHNFPTCSRCGNNVEFLSMPEYYLKQIDYIPTLLQYADNLIFYPSFMRQVWLDWLNTVSIDWPISRRRYYGTEIPIWYCKSCNHPNLPEPGPYYQPWKDAPPFEKCEKCGSSEGFVGDIRTFDTWMDSSISEIYTIMHPHNKKDEELFQKLNSRPYICDMRPQGKDIVRTWLHYTMLRGLQLYQKPAFKEAWISGHVVDSKGEKMSKSRGTAVHPEEMIEKYGGDAVRLYGASEASHGSDIRFNQQRLQGVSKFITKLYNIARFVSRFPIIEDEQSIKLQAADEWVLSELAKEIKNSILGYEVFDFQVPSRALRNFTKEIFASHYLELVKGRAYNRNGAYTEEQQKAAWYTLHKVLREVIKAFSPIIPFITDFIYRGLYNKTVHLESFPDPKKIILEQKYLNLTPLLLEVNSAIWKYKKNLKLPLNKPIKKAYLPKSLSVFINDLCSMHMIESVSNNKSELDSVEPIVLNGQNVLILDI
ncbi:MAG: valine--tRNA ligase [Candidatus Heimdallarchaeaceae archaeon]